MWFGIFCNNNVDAESARNIWACGAAKYGNGLGSTDTTFSPKPASAIQSVGPYILY